MTDTKKMSLEATSDSDRLRAFAEKLISIDDEIFNELHVSLLSHESRLIFHAILEHSLTVKGAALSSRLSPRSFTNLLKCLQDNDVIDLIKSDIDGRSKHITLSAPVMRALLAHCVFQDKVYESTRP
jgi:hypothetical protein